jgi:hypothetical protein
MALGTLAGGWRIVRTMGMGITKLKPVGGFCAETAGTVTLVDTAVAGKRPRPPGRSSGCCRRWAGTWPAAS